MLDDIEYLVLQGGGIRCAWQAGFVTVLESEGPFRPQAISAVSASCAVACAIACRRLEFAVNCFKTAIEESKKETRLNRIFRGGRVFSHAEIYRNALLCVFDQASIERLHLGPEIRVLITRTSAELPRYPGLLLGWLLALGTLRMRESYPRFASRFGFSGEFIRANECATPAELADLVLASSCTPPFTPWYSLHGRPALDGGLCESVPLSWLPETPRRTLALLTTKDTPKDHRPGVLYAEPSVDLGIASWDFKDTGNIDRLYALGKKDAGAFLKTAR